MTVKEGPLFPLTSCFVVLHLVPQSFCLCPFVLVTLSLSLCFCRLVFAHFLCTFVLENLAFVLLLLSIAVALLSLFFSPSSNKIC